MPLITGIKRHNVINHNLTKTIDTFFSYTKWEDIFLTGGTCLAEFYLGHRDSIDIDLFTDKLDVFQTVRQLFKNPSFFSFGNLKIQREFPEFCSFLLHLEGQDPIKIDLVVDRPKQIERKILFENIWLDHPADITCNKIGCILQRNEVKDYIDLFYLLPEFSLNPKDIIELGLRKDAAVDPILLAYQMQYIQTIQSPPHILKSNIPWKNVLKFYSTLHDEILDYAKNL